MSILFVPEKRHGQDYLGFYLPEGKRDLFREYCQFIDSTMKDELEKVIDQCIVNPKFQRYLEIKRNLQSEK
jgi:hypothetical protein